MSADAIVRRSVPVCLLALLFAAASASAEVDESPLPVEVKVAFPNLKWTGWSPVTDEGRLEPLRPIVLTHAGDGTDRIFVATQQGVVHVFPNDPQAKRTKIFLDVRDRVVYTDKENEEGLLGLAFHPKYRENGQFFLYYTTTDAPHTSVVSRFRVSPDDPDLADAHFEEELLRIPQPFWNHNGGTLAFGPDGYLYIGLGDGGAANDPHEHGQNLGTLLGSILRIDVDRKDPGLGYAVPKDNPCVGRDDARDEIWAYGLRNVWRMAFDRETGTLWAADVGQDLWEEINLIVKGGNYGWNLREGMHPFGKKGTGPRPDLIEPIWEYHHDVGKSITGGHVYRGKQVPELVGTYLYGDYITGLLWALRYDEDEQKVVANHPIRAEKLAVITFGEDERGEAYCTVVSPNGRGIYRFVRAGN
jgi:glucose/arabinose dehydrogenase